MKGDWGGKPDRPLNEKNLETSDKNEGKNQ